MIRVLCLPLPCSCSTAVPPCLLCLQGDRSPEAFKPPNLSTSDPISALTASEGVMMLGRASGVVHRYSLPHLTPEGQHVLRCRPQVGGRAHSEVENRVALGTLENGHELPPPSPGLW